MRKFKKKNEIKGPLYLESERVKIFRTHDVVEIHGSRRTVTDSKETNTA